MIFAEHIPPIYNISDRSGLHAINPGTKIAAIIALTLVVSKIMGLANTVLTMPIWLGFFYVLFAPQKWNKKGYCIPVLNAVRTPPFLVIVTVFLLANAPYIGEFL